MALSDQGYKVVLLGDSGVGKTSTIIRYTEHIFRKNTTPTVGSGIFTEDVETERGPVTMTIWDTAGEERYRSFTGLYSQGSDAALIVFDVTSFRSFESLSAWIDVFHESTDCNLIFIIGNKIDCESGRQVSYEQGYEWSIRHGYKYAETSAKTGESITSVFHDLAISLLNENAVIQGQLYPIGRENTRCCV